VAGLGPLSPPSIELAPGTGFGAGAPAPGGQAPAAGAAGAAGPDLGVAGQAENPAAAQWLALPEIRGLDIPAALQILWLEVSDALGIASPAPPAAGADQAAVAIVDAFLQSLPATDPIRPDDPAGLAWIGAADRLQTVLEGGLDRAQSIVGAWPGVTAEVIESVAGSRAMIGSALLDAPLPTFLARPEWLGLAPRIERHLRRRRMLRRRLQDPDERTAR